MKVSKKARLKAKVEARELEIARLSMHLAAAEALVVRWDRGGKFPECASQLAAAIGVQR